MTSNKYKFIPSFFEKFEGLIWKIELNEKYSLLAIESRNTELRKTAFSVINYKTGKVYFKEKILEEPWNLNLAYIAEKNLIITAYGQAESPESKGIISVHIQDAEVLWEHYNLTLNWVTDEGLKVYDPRINPRRYSWISHIKGEPIEDPDNINPETNTLLFPQLMDSLLIPDFILSEKLVGETSALVFRDLTIVSFHEKIQNNIQQRLLVYQDDSILLDEILIRDIQKLQPESFFMQKNHLFYIRNKNEIVSYLV